MINEFQIQAENEQKQIQAQQLEAIFTMVTDLTKEVKILRKENRTIREELRNLDKLRPLRSPKEEDEEIEVSEGVIQEAAQK